MATILFLSSIWPESTSTAAGVRSMQLLSQLKQLGHHITLASPGKRNHFSEEASRVFDHTFTLAINDPSTLNILQDNPPDFCIYDRFYLEEQYSWLVRQKFPKCIQIIDTQDLHFLRQHRQQMADTGQSIETLIESRPTLDNEQTLREIASLLRADLSLIISPYEKTLLINQFFLPAHKLVYLPLFYGDPPPPCRQPRQHCVFIGNYRHRPNLDAVEWLCHEIWPLVHQQFPHQQLHLYGSYMPQRIQQLANAQQGIHSKGHAPNQYHTLGKYQALLAPLRFGAGLKGKILDAALCATPTITTSIGAEGIGDEHFWQNKVANTAQTFADCTRALLASLDNQTKQQQQARELIQTHYHDRLWTPTLNNIFARADHWRTQKQQDPFSAILWYSQHRYTQAFAQWIEAKNKPSK